MEIDGPEGAFFLVNYAGFYFGAVGQNVDINGSPIVISFDPPIKDVPTIDLGALYQAIKAKLGVS